MSEIQPVGRAKVSGALLAAIALATWFLAAGYELCHSQQFGTPSLLMAALAGLRMAWAFVGTVLAITLRHMLIGAPAKAWQLLASSASGLSALAFPAVVGACPFSVTLAAYDVLSFFVGLAFGSVGLATESESHSVRRQFLPSWVMSAICAPVAAIACIELMLSHVFAIDHATFRAVDARESVHMLPIVLDAYLILGLIDSASPQHIGGGALLLGAPYVARAIAPALWPLWQWTGWAAALLLAWTLRGERPRGVQ